MAAGNRLNQAQVLFCGLIARAHEKGPVDNGSFDACGNQIL
jgi:hypothetical protein